MFPRSQPPGGRNRPLSAGRTAKNADRNPVFFSMVHKCPQIADISNGYTDICLSSMYKPLYSSVNPRHLSSCYRQSNLTSAHSGAIMGTRFIFQVHFPGTTVPENCFPSAKGRPEPAVFSDLYVPVSRGSFLSPGSKRIIPGTMHKGHAEIFIFDVYFLEL